MTAKAKAYAAGNSQKGNLNLSLSSLHSLKNLVRSLVKISGVAEFQVFSETLFYAFSITKPHLVYAFLISH